MKPLSRSVRHSSNYLLASIPANFGVKSTIAGIKGSVKKLGINYQQALIVLYNKTDLSPLAVRKPDQNGDYQFLGLNTDLKTFIAGFDDKQQFNAVIQDNVVPK